MQSSEPTIPSDQGANGPYAEESASIAHAAHVAVEAVAAARVLTSGAAIAARHNRFSAGQVAEHLVVEQAAQDAAATRFRADAAATKVRRAAEVAVLTAKRGEADPVGPAALLRAAETAATVQAAAAAVAEETAALALSVAAAVATTAKLVRATRLSLDRAIEAEVKATAAALEIHDLATAAVAAADAERQR